MKYNFLTLFYCYLYHPGSAKSTSHSSLGPASVSELARAEQAFIQERIVPDVLQEFHPTLVMKVAYPAANSTNSVLQLGQKISEDVSAHQPQVFVEVPKDSPFNTTESSGAVFTLVMIDPDAPSRDKPYLGQFLHLFATGVQMTPTSTPKTYKLDFAASAVIPYMAPEPPSGTGYHRYIFLLCLGQPRDSAISSLEGPHPSRAGFKVQEFISSSGLGDQKAHQPIAGTFIQIKS